MFQSQADAVREWLEGYRQEEAELDELLDRIRTLRAAAMSVHAQELSFLPKSHNNSGDPLSDYMIRLEALEGRMERRLRIHEQERAALVDLTRRIRGDDEREIIVCRYLYGMGWPEIRKRLYGKEPEYLKKADTYERRMFRAHSRALEWMGRFWDQKKTGPLSR